MPARMVSRTTRQVKIPALTLGQVACSWLLSSDGTPSALLDVDGHRNDRTTIGSSVAAGDGSADSSRMVYAPAAIASTSSDNSWSCLSVMTCSGAIPRHVQCEVGQQGHRVGVNQEPSTY